MSVVHLLFSARYLDIEETTADTISGDYKAEDKSICILCSVCVYKGGQKYNYQFRRRIRTEALLQACIIL